ncbi:MAG: peptide chain release factor N(5)-glutamine methyltransferase, partial [Oscillospiraceae bacterium]
MLISEFYSRLLHENEEISKFDLSQIFEQALKIKLPFSFLSEEISEEAVAEIEKSLKRLKSGEPLQYILGEWEFYGLPFYVGEGVLIPRADTETLVDTAIPLIKSGDIIADFCAGSGAIAISLGKNTCAKKIYAVEFY